MYPVGKTLKKYGSTSFKNRANDMDLQCQRYEYASGVAFCPLFDTNNGIPLWEMKKAPKIFSFPSVRICYQQTYSAILPFRSFVNPSFCLIKKAEKIHSRTPSVFSVFVYMCVCGAREALWKPEWWGPFMLQINMLIIA